MTNILCTYTRIHAWKAHDLSQQLQDKIEVLPNVGRAFAHVDHETTHTPDVLQLSTI